VKILPGVHSEDEQLKIKQGRLQRMAGVPSYKQQRRYRSLKLT
jgi:hypothetical protein